MMRVCSFGNTSVNGASTISERFSLDQSCNLARTHIRMTGPGDATAMQKDDDQSSVSRVNVEQAERDASRSAGSTRAMFV